MDTFAAPEPEQTSSESKGLVPPKAAQLSDVDIVVVHYAHVRPTVAMLHALFRHYPEAEVTLVDNSGGSCSVTDLVLPHLGALTERIRVLVNPADDRGPSGGLSHGAGIDWARKHCARPYLLSMESDTFVLLRGCIEFVLALMDAGYDWAGVGQKPVDGTFASVSPSFAIFRVALLEQYDVSFRRRQRTPEEHDPEDPLIRHHRLAAEAAERGLPLVYPEGKPPDTYRRPLGEIVATEKGHERYFDTGEWVHRVLCNKGHRGYLFRSLPSFCHTWGSRDEALFLRNFRHQLPDVDLNQFLPPALQVAIDLRPVSLLALSLVDPSNYTPASHWQLRGATAERLTAHAERLHLDLDAESQDKVYLALGNGKLDEPPPEVLNARVAASALCTLHCRVTTTNTIKVELWFIEYGGAIRIQHHVCRRANSGEYALNFVTSPSTNRFRVLFRFSGKGSAYIADLRLSVGSRDIADERSTTANRRLHGVVHFTGSPIDRALDGVGAPAVINEETGQRPEKQN